MSRRPRGRRWRATTNDMTIDAGEDEDEELEQATRIRRDDDDCNCWCLRNHNILLFLLMLTTFLVITSASASEISRDLSSIDYQHHQTTLSSGGGDDDDNSKQQLLAKRAIGPQRTSTSATGSAKMMSQQQQQLQSLSMLGKITDADLLPFEEFLVEQPAFSDIMKAWPASTTSSTSRPSTSANPPASFKTQSKSYNGQRTASTSNNNNKASTTQTNFLDRWMSSTAAQQDVDGTIVRNHLNEDFDDTIISVEENFEQDQLPEPPTWVNYLGELGDFIYTQLHQFYDSSPKSPFTWATSTSTNSTLNTSTKPSKLEAIEDLLDDYYYDQYENSQVLYYGPQLVRLGDTFEIGCYLPNEQPAEWTKSGKSLAGSTASGAQVNGRGGANSSATDEGEASAATVISVPVAGNPLRVIKKSNFLGAKQNYSLKIYEAQLSDSGNYRCNRLSRKYHKLIVVPAKISSQQLYLIQQKLLSIIRPDQVASHLSVQQIQAATLATSMRQLASSTGSGSPVNQSSARRLSIQASGTSVDTSRGRQLQGQPLRNSQASISSSSSNSQTSSSSQLLLPGHLIVENQPLIVTCNLTDSALLSRLREHPNFQLAWYKNGRLLRNSQLQQQQQQQQTGSSAAATYTSSSLSRANRLQQRAGNSNQANIQAKQQRVQFVGPNGRQMFITSANYADAGDYLCSWSRLPASNSAQDPTASGAAGEESGDDATISGYATAPPAPVSNPLAEGSLQQLVSPVKLRPFKSSYDVREGDQLRLICQVQRGYPVAQISWYVGNRLVDGDFLRDHPGHYQVLQLQARDAGAASRLQSARSSASAASGEPEVGGQIVEINPIPASRLQMQMTASGRGQWVEFKRAESEKYAISGQEQQTKYLQMKMAQLTGANSQVAVAQQQTGSEQLATTASQSQLQQASLSVLVINKLEQERDTSRYACRATSRANTDEVTTVIRVKALATQIMRPFNGKATLVPGQPLNFECWQIGNPTAQFLWFKRAFVPATSNGADGETTATTIKPTEQILTPNEDDTVEIHNNRLALLKPNYQSIGDYICRDMKNETEQAIIQLRAQPYIDDFGVETSHTGKSTVIAEGQRLVLTCHIRDDLPVFIQWLRSESPDDERRMVEVPEYDSRGRKLSWDGKPPDEEDLFVIHGTDNPALLMPTHRTVSNMRVEAIDKWTKQLIIDTVGQEHRGHYACVVDNKVTDRARKQIFVRVTDNIVALWPFLGILAELFILFTIIYVWETQRAQKALDGRTSSSSSSAAGGGGQTPAKSLAYQSASSNSSSSSKRPASGPSNAFESVPLNR